MKNTLLVLISLTTSHMVMAETMTTQEVSRIATNSHISDAIAGEHYTYNNKDYYLIFSKKQSKEKVQGEILDVINIATRFVDNNDNKPKIKWAMVDYIKCPGLDISADFIPQATTFNAIKPHSGNEDNVEVTVGYKMFCGGGVDPKTLKVLYHDNNRKVALRGETEIYFKHDRTRTGGQYEEDKAFKIADKPIKEHLIKLWNTVKTETF